MKPDVRTRRSFSTALASAVAFALGSRGASAQGRATNFQPARHTQDAWLDTLPGKHRTIIDGSTINGGELAMLYAYNLYESNKTGYALSDSDVAVVVCLRHAATNFAFNDAMWAKYAKPLNARGELTDPKTKQPPTTNLLWSVDYGLDLPNYGVTIQELVGKGTRFAVCEMATHGAAGAIADETGGNADAIYRELVANLVPNSRMVPAGVLAITRAQEYGYSLVTPV